MAGVLDKLNEFDRVAGLLQMPLAERTGILNIPADTYERLQQRDPGAVAAIEPELERRLSYALPLMRRLASNSPVVGMPKSRRAA